VAEKEMKSSILGWQNVQLAHNFSQSVRCDDSHMKDWILLDSQSTIHHFCNPQYVGDIKQAERFSSNMTIEKYTYDNYRL
jgi:hypothetical protein